jgi:hypothetical protein
VAGLLLGGTLSGTVAGALGAAPVALLPAAVRWWLLAVALAVVLSFELAGRPLRLPQNRRAVPQEIIPRSDADGPLQFGFEMGTGVRTYMPSAIPHALLLAVLLVGGLGPGIVAGVGFGLGRALMPTLRARYRTPSDWDGLLLRRAPVLYATSAIGFAGLLIALGAA